MFLPHRIPSADTSSSRVQRAVLIAVPAVLVLAPSMFLGLRGGISLPVLLLIVAAGLIVGIAIGLLLDRACRHRG
jgi:hypothetical protein